MSEGMAIEGTGAARGSAASAASAAIAAPDWSQQVEELLCPLCDYNLRGLSEGRCPECGHRFEWAVLLDRGALHPYLFEHHPRRNWWSFWRTYLGDCLAKRFWTELTPVDAVRMRRLVLYWALSNLPILILVAAPFVQFGWHEWQQNLSRRSQLTAVGAGYYRMHSGAIFPGWQVNQIWPMPGSSAYFRHVWLRVKHQGDVGVMLIPLWGWMTVAALMVFQLSMRRAKIKSAHVVRCGIYCCDFSFAALAGIAMGGNLFLMYCCPVIALYRLTIAYRQYMRLDMPFFTALAAQIMVWLAMVTLLVNL